MLEYLEIIRNAYTGYWNYLSSEILNPSWTNYFYWLIALSLVVWAIELMAPWRKEQGAIRKDFWMDVFYMFFNFFLFSLIIYNAVSNVAVQLWSDLFGVFGLENKAAIEFTSWPIWLKMGVAFVVADFIQWNIHRMLHRVPWMWNFHKVHHSVKEMGFAAHLRFHWMETVIYKTVQYIPLSLLGLRLDEFFILHMIALLIGHLNHANLGWSYGPFKYLINNPKMHIWHHAKELPDDHRYGVNFGISLSVWDYIFKTAFVPNDGRDIELGFAGDEHFPEDLPRQLVYPLSKE